MNFTLVSLGLALAKPLVSFLAERGRRGAAAAAGNSPLFTLVHAIRGRRRYRSELLRDSAFAESFRRKLLGISGMKAVTVNPVTGSALLEYTLDDSVITELFQEMNQVSAAAGEESFFARAAQACGGDPGNSGSGRGREISRRGSFASGGGYPGDTGIREIFFASLAGVSRSISARTGGSLDLNSLLGLLLAGRGLYKIVKHGQLPSGPQLLWWGYNLFKSRGRYVRAVS